MSSSPPTPRSLDREKTEMQAVGALYVAGLTVEDVVEIVTDLGLDPGNVKFEGGSMYVVRDSRSESFRG